MKDSKVKWIGQIPDDWNLVKLKDICTYKKEIAGENSICYQRLSLTLNGIIVRDKQDFEGVQPKVFDTYQIIEENDFVFKMIDLKKINTSRIGLSTHKGLISPAYTRFVPRNKNQYNKFIYYYMLSLWQNHIFNNISRSEVRKTLSPKDLENFPCPFPKENIQRKIGSFLDDKCSKIERLIIITKKQIEKLKEYKETLISEIVTKGLNSNTNLKSSGSRFLGSIPEHWKVCKIKHIASRIEKGNGITKEEIIPEGEISCLRYGDIYTQYDVSFSKCQTRTNKDFVSKPKYFKYGDILFSGTGELVEEIGKNIVYLGNEKCLAGGDVIILEHNQNPLFLSYFLNSFACKRQKSYGKAKIKVVHISSSEIGNITIALPPLEEQKKIASYLDNKCAKINALIRLKENKIIKLNEYKKSLIYECVTGKHIN